MIGGVVPLAVSNPASVLLLNLFEDTALTASLDHLETNPSGSFSWIGHIQGMEHSQVLLVVKDGIMIGNVSTLRAMYQVRYAGEAQHVIREVTPAALPREAEPLLTESMEARRSVATESLHTDDGSGIDVMVLYTTSARVAAGGTIPMQSLIDLAVAETNQSFANSSIGSRLHLVHAEEVTYAEVGDDLRLDLVRLRDTSDGQMDHIHALRDEHSADLVNLIVNNGEYCGRAFLMTDVSTSFASWAFSVVKRSCATGYYTFAHELGHNMAARHDWYVDDQVNSPYSFNHGYVNRTDRWRTVMAYNDHCDDDGVYCTRLLYWSNPDAMFSGQPMGVPQGTATDCLEGSSLLASLCDADNRTTLNNTAHTVANFRVAMIPSPTSTATATETATARSSATSTPTQTPVASATPTATGVATHTSTPTSTATRPTPTPTVTPDGAAILVGHVELQGRPEPPDSRWIISVDVELRQAGALMYAFGDVPTDQSGVFSIGGIAIGTYDIWIDNFRTLSNMRADVVLESGITSVYMGELQEGDASGDNLIDIEDFGYLKRSFGTPSPSADFNQDGWVDIDDFALLKLNFGELGDVPVTTSKAAIGH